MRLVVNIVLLLIIVLLGWVLIQSIREPIAFQAERTKREDAVIERLRQIRTTQEMFRSIKGGFAPSFDSLIKVLSTEKFATIKVIGDPDDPNFTGTVQFDTIFTPAIDSIKRLGINLDSLRYVPYGENHATFDIQADTITYQSTNVPVVEVGVPREKFMGPYKDKRFARYDQKYDPKKPIKFGNMGAPNLSGNWE
ncbi:MAG TPA: hypothetical protein PKE06_07475 [Flavilitoribacter sp.]|nr:hypothetical protein [Lewinella sp.]MCB9278739.1 hypothetical protein [Lewinellaceae bacterium]HMQ60490.1 hypothetical protein [Flavilitoribacter sp.]HMQ89785.1 hypothetical protein [Flavilitoribacter sp.]